MEIRSLHLVLLDGLFVICKLPPDADLPAWAITSRIFSVTRTAEELSVVCPQAQVPAGVRSEPGWRCFRVAGTMDFSEIGVLASLVAPLAAKDISVFALSTFDTDYVLVKEEDLERAKAVLCQAGHVFVSL